VNSEKPISTPQCIRHLQLVGNIVLHSDFALQNGNQKRKKEKKAGE